MELVEQLLQGDRRAIARLITVVENGDRRARQALAELYPHTGQAHIVGVTGAPGTGKSTLVNELAQVYRRRQVTVGIVAVDPTSPFSGGAILGDRIRMRELSGDPGIFIRSMATRGSLGGLARATADVVKVLDAAGFEVILVETVGAGQSEVDIAKMAHTTVVVEVPGLGDDIQAIKAGILEIADIFAVNKADREGADKTVMTLHMMLDLDAHAPKVVWHHGQMEEIGGAVEDDEGQLRWRPPVRKTVALRGEGVEALVDVIAEHREFLQKSQTFYQREWMRVDTEFERILGLELLQRLRQRVEEGRIREMTDRIVRREIDPYSAAETLLVEAFGCD